MGELVRAMSFSALIRERAEIRCIEDITEGRETGDIDGITEGQKNIRNSRYLRKCKGGGFVIFLKSAQRLRDSVSCKQRRSCPTTAPRCMAQRGDTPPY